MTRAQTRLADIARINRTVACFRALEGQCEGAELTAARNVLHAADSVLCQHGLSPLFARYERSMGAVHFRIVKGDKMTHLWATESTLTLGGKGPLAGTMQNALHQVCETA